jgi:hypothetical protein
MNEEQPAKRLLHVAWCVTGGDKPVDDLVKLVLPIQQSTERVTDGRELHVAVGQGIDQHAIVTDAKPGPKAWPVHAS